MKTEYVTRLNTLFDEPAFQLVTNPNWKLLSSSWDGFCQQHLLTITDEIAEVFKEWYGDDCIYSRRLMIINKGTDEERPECISCVDIISLYCIDLYQYIYQLSHELCHYMTYKNRSSVIPSTIMWFVEIMCEVSSMCIINKLAGRGIVDRILSGESMNSYLERHLASIPTLSTMDLFSLYFEKADYLRRKSDDRCINNIFAKAIYPYMIEHPEYWVPLTHLSISGLEENMNNIELLSKLFDSLPLQIKGNYLQLVSFLKSFAHRREVPMHYYYSD